MKEGRENPENITDTVVEEQVSSYKNIVSAWMQKSALNSKPRKRSSSTSNGHSASSANIISGRPPRLGIGAKPGNQKEQISNSVFLNQKLARTLTGQSIASQKKEEGSFMQQYSAKKPQPSKRADPDSDEEESRSKSIGTHKKQAGSNPKNKRRK